MSSVPGRWVAGPALHCTCHQLSWRSPLGPSSQGPPRLVSPCPGPCAGLAGTRLTGRQLPRPTGHSHTSRGGAGASPLRAPLSGLWSPGRVPVVTCRPDPPHSVLPSTQNVPTPRQTGRLPGPDLSASEKPFNRRQMWTNPLTRPGISHICKTEEMTTNSRDQTRDAGTGLVRGSAAVAFGGPCRRLPGPSAAWRPQ